MTFRELQSAYLAWGSGELSNGEFLAKLEAYQFTVRVCETAPPSDTQWLLMRDWLAAVASDILCARELRPLGVTGALPCA